MYSLDLFPSIWKGSLKVLETIWWLMCSSHTAGWSGTGRSREKSIVFAYRQYAGKSSSLTSLQHMLFQNFSDQRSRGSCQSSSLDIKVREVFVLRHTEDNELCDASPSSWEREHHIGDIFLFFDSYLERSHGISREM